MELYDKALIVGLTGMSGAGKTTACETFRELGFDVIDCDRTARRVTEPGKKALVRIAERFGAEYINADGTLDRRRLGGLVFSSADDLSALNEIIYPYILYDMITEINALVKNGSKLILLDAPTLFESGAHRLCSNGSMVVSIVADKETCIKRIRERDGLTYRQAAERLSSQHDEQFYINNSALCIKNNDSEEELRSRLLEKIKPLIFNRVMCG